MMTPKAITEQIQAQLREMVEREKQDLRAARQVMSRVSMVMGDVSIKRKSSWPGFVERLLGAMIDGSGLYNDVVAYMEANDRERVCEDIPLDLQYFGLNRESDVVFERDDVRAMEARTTCGISFWAVHYGNDTCEWDLYAHQDTDPKALYESLSKMLWARRKSSLVRLDLRKSQDTYGPGEVVVTSVQPGEYEYIGALSKSIEQWAKFRRRGIRRNVLLQGKPGSGKSTLCLHAARVLSKRCVQVNATVYEAFNGAGWVRLLDLLNPDMLILDDIDRVGSSVLGSKLESFEENKGVNVPFILFTSNDIEQIPQAFRRPGRIDQILYVKEPSETIREAMVSRFAADMGVGPVPEVHMARLVGMLTTHSGAHVIEALKRAKVLGWGYEPSEEDKTFSAPKKE